MLSLEITEIHDHRGHDIELKINYFSNLLSTFITTLASPSIKAACSYK
jgi:hypothetical protein